MDKHLVLQVLIQARGCFTDEGSNDDGLCTVAETRDRIMGGVNIMI